MLLKIPIKLIKLIESTGNSLQRRHLLKKAIQEAYTGKIYNGFLKLQTTFDIYDILVREIYKPKVTNLRIYPKYFNIFK